MTGSGQSRRFNDVCDESGLPPNPDVLPRRSKPTRRAYSRSVGKVADHVAGAIESDYRGAREIDRYLTG